MCHSDAHLQQGCGLDHFTSSHHIASAFMRQSPPALQPNLTYAKELVAKMGLGDAPSGDVPDFGAACDGDADRNMILGEESSIGCPDIMPGMRSPVQSLSSMLPMLAAK